MMGFIEGQEARRWARRSKGAVRSGEAAAEAVAALQPPTPT